MSGAIRGRTALVTGGGNGLGRAIAASLAQAGARLIIVGRRRAELQEACAALAGAGAACRAAACDIADPASVDALRADLADEDVSILINNAGVPGPVARSRRSHPRSGTPCPPSTCAACT